MFTNEKIMGMTLECITALCHSRHCEVCEIGVVRCEAIFNHAPSVTHKVLDSVYIKNRKEYEK